MFDLIVIGGGPGGYAAAEYAAHQGMQVALVERNRLGGTCLHRGCVPTKAYLHAAETVHAATAFAPDALARFDRRAMLQHKDSLVEKLAGGIGMLMKTAKVTVINGHGTLLDSTSPFAVQVKAEDGAAQTITAKQVLMATGSEPARLPVKGCDDPAVLTSDELLSAPGAEDFTSLLIIGGGVIGVEMACVYARLGVTVTIVEAEARLLPMMDIDLGRSIEAQLKSMGVVIHTGAMLQHITKDDAAFSATVEKSAALMAMQAERVLLATGRMPVTDGLFAQTIEPQMNRRNIAVDAHYQTSIPGVYAIGDVNGIWQLAHAAHAQGIAAVSHMLGVPSPMDATLVPSCVYTQPEIASIGLTQAQAVEQSIPVTIGKALTTQNARNLIEGLGRGFIKLVFHQQTRKLLGAQLFCGRATDLVGELTLAIQSGLTAQQLLLPLRAHPTFEESITDAVLAAKFG